MKQVPRNFVASVDNTAAVVGGVAGRLGNSLPRTGLTSARGDWAEHAVERMGCTEVAG